MNTPPITEVKQKYAVSTWMVDHVSFSQVCDISDLDFFLATGHSIQDKTVNRWVEIWSGSRIREDWGNMKYLYMKSPTHHDKLEN